jgi:hypothetical protein
MGKKKQAYDNIVHEQLEKTVQHVVMMWKMKKVAFFCDPDTKRLEGRAEHIDDTDPNDNTDPNITYLLAKVPEEVEVTGALITAFVNMQCKWVDAAVPKSRGHT